MIYCDDTGLEAFMLVSALFNSSDLDILTYSTRSQIKIMFLGFAPIFAILNSSALISDQNIWYSSSAFNYDDAKFLFPIHLFVGNDIII